MKRKPALKEKSEGGDEPALSARTCRGFVPTGSSTESLTKLFVHFSPVAVPEKRYRSTELACVFRPRPLARRRCIRPRRRGVGLPLHPPFAVCTGRIRLSHPAFCSNTKSSVVLLCLPHHRSFVIGELLLLQKKLSRGGFRGFKVLFWKNVSGDTFFGQTGSI